MKKPGLCASQAKSRPLSNSETCQTIVFSRGCRTRTRLPTPKAERSRRSTFAIDEVQSGQCSTFTRTGHTTSGGRSISTDISMFIPYLSAALAQQQFCQGTKLFWIFRGRPGWTRDTSRNREKLREVIRALCASVFVFSNYFCGGFECEGPQRPSC